MQSLQAVERFDAERFIFLVSVSSAVTQYLTEQG